MNNNPIGIIDSGIGGLSVWQEIVKLLPVESTLYLADSKYLPYGEKDEAEIYRLSKRLIHYLLKQQVKLVVIACNTITVSALEQLRRDFPSLPIIGTVPVVKTALRQAQGKPPKIGILSTKRTAESIYLQNLIDQFAQDAHVVNLGTDKLVSMVESGEVDMDVLREELQPFLDADIDTLALGCTHFPFLRNEMQEVLGKDVHILDSGEAIARQVKRILESEKEISDKGEGEHTFYTTGEEKQFAKQIQRLVGSRDSDTIREVNL